MQDADAIQWAIDQIDSLKKRNERTQEERDYLHDLELMKNKIEYNHRRKAFKKPTA